MAGKVVNITDCSSLNLLSDLTGNYYSIYQHSYNLLLADIKRIRNFIKIEKVRMEKIQKTNFKLAGLKLEERTTNENNQSSKDCGNLWQKFEKDKIFGLIANKLTNEIYAVYFDYEKTKKIRFRIS